MTPIVIYDAMSALRVRLEQKHEPAHMLLRGVLNDAVVPGRLTIWVFDGKGGNDRRRAIFPNYKNRPPAPGATYTMLRLLQELLGYTAAWQAQLDGFEGDDIIAALVDNFRGKGQIEIHTRDADLIALGVPCRGVKTNIPARDMRLFKLCCGDSSDTIPGIKGFGEGAWAGCDKEGVRQLIDKIIAHEPWDEGHALAVGIPSRSIKWLKENPDLLGAMRRVIEPLPMTMEQLSRAIKQGVDNAPARNAALQRYLL
jgi:hypothetical protein